MKKKKTVFIILGILIFSILIAGITYALYKFVLFDDLTVETATPGLDYYINYTKGQDITNGILNIGSDYTSGNSASVEFWKKDNTYDIYGQIYLDINSIGSNLASESGLKYTVVNNDNVIASGTLAGTSSGSSLILVSNIPLETSSQLYTVYIWLDENVEVNTDIEGESLSASIRCEATMKAL